MLSFTKTDGSKKVARVKGGENDGKFVYLDVPGEGKESVSTYLSKDFYKKLPKTMKKQDLVELKSAIDTQHEPEKEELKQYWKEAMDDIKENTKRGIRLRSGKMIPLPQKKVVEKLYVSGPSGAGKSTYCGNWLKEYRKMYPDDEVYVFSSVQQDKVLDKFDPERIPMDLNVAQLQPQDFAESVCIFDDVDTITDSRVRKAVCALRDNLLECGRHYETRMLATSHIIANYNSTRRLLNEATSVSFFPKAGSSFHVKRFLQHYAGLSKKQISRILALPSRWVSLYKTYPMFILYEKGAYVLCDDE